MKFEMSASHPLHVVILAAGQGTRMKSSLPKVLQPVGGKPMLGHVLNTSCALGADLCHVVYGHGGETVRAWARETYGHDKPINWVAQLEQLGTAHAVAQVLPDLPDAARVLVLYGDVPLITEQTLRALLASANGGIALLTTRPDNPYGYGRILRDAEGEIIGIVEEKDANDLQRAIGEVNTGVMAVSAKLLKHWLPLIRNDNAKGEYYLTDIVGMAASAAVRMTSVEAHPDEVEGVNDRVQLARMERVLQLRQAEALMREGVRFADPARFDLRGELRAGRDVSIDVGVVMEGSIELGDKVSVGPYCVLKNVRVAAGAQILPHSVLENCEIGEDAQVGPFSRLRPGARLERNAHVGNFVELKNATLGEGSKANHLAYVGDARIGARVNVGAGVITCNYDGANKHKTVIGDDVFIGSDTQLVAPVDVGAGATIGAGSTITRDVPAGGLTLCRAREQKTFPNWQRPTKTK